jgi:hypothetical protein
MQTISCYELSFYTSINSNRIPVPNSIDDLLSPMHLFLHATVRCQTILEPPQSTLFQQEYPTWKRFIGEIEQYADRETRVMTLFQSYLTLKKFNIWLCVDITQPNLKNPLTVLQPGRLLDISFAYVFSDESDPTPSHHRPVNGMVFMLAKLMIRIRNC